MSLREYQRKRHFDRTPEPSGDGKAAAAAVGRSFVIQKHAASHLHYDFRLEEDGVLKSWAVPKGPSLDPADKRLAVEVEDHPLDYGGFEGVIPKGEYGGGTVLLWDRGTWEPEGSARDGLRKGRLHFRLHGEKLRGEWILVRTSRGDGNGTKPQWLLRKIEDDEARTGKDAAIVERRPESVATGRGIEAIAAQADRVWSSHAGEVETAAASPAVDPGAIPGAKRARLPATIAPQLATLVDSAPAGGGWLHEIKFDGYRALCRLQKGKAQILTRNGKDWTDSFASIATAARALRVDEAVLDGEVVALEPDGRSSFQALQRSLKAGGELVYYVFDLLFLDGWDLRGCRLEARKELLAALLATLPPRGAIRFSDHVEGGGEAFFRQACRLALEGTIAKRRASPYAGGRGRDWLKIKCLARQELVIGGYSDPEGARTGFGALLVGYHEESDHGGSGPLVFAGKVGTGFDAATLRDLHRRMKALEQKEPPFANPPRGAAARGVHWIRPELVAEVEFTEWTADGVLRHPSFQGLRDDKPAAQVRRERAASAGAKPAKAKTAEAKRPKADADPEPPRPSRIAPPAYRPGGAASERRSRRQERGPGSGGSEIEVAGIRISHPDRVLYPEQGLTKGDLARYYLDVADAMLPHVAGRPLTLVRCPQGRGKQCFYQKHVAETLPEALGSVPVREESGETKPYLVVHDAPGLVALVQLGVLEVHLWGAREDDIEKPDRLIFDLDPDPSVAWPSVVTAAFRLRALLADLGLESWLKTTGGKGLHVVVPIARRSTWDEAREFSRAVAQRMARESPEQFTIVVSKAKRVGRIFLDYLRNARGSTAIAPYSTRAREGAPVATPIAWDELDARLVPGTFDVESVRKRLASQKQDPWRDLAKRRQGITKAARAKVGLR